jgi:hypothetical protein
LKGNSFPEVNQTQLNSNQRKNKMDFKTFKQNRGQMSESLAKMREEKEAKTFTDDSYYK